MVFWWSDKDTNLIGVDGGGEMRIENVNNSNNLLKKFGNDRRKG